MTISPAARTLAWFFAVAGGLALLGAFVLPGSELTASQRTAVAVLALADLVVAAAMALLPWHRWSPRTTLLGWAVALALIAAFGVAGLTTAPGHALFLVLGFTWLGVYHPRRWIWLSAIPAGIAYAVPLQIAGHPREDVGAVLIVVPACVLVAATVAEALRRQQLALSLADRRAELLRIVASAGRRASQLDPALVTQEILVAVRKLGFAAGMVQTLGEDGTVRVEAASGIDVPTGTTFPIDGSLAGRVREALTSVTVVGPDASQAALALQDMGFDRVLAAPVWMGDWVGAVLLAADRRPGHVLKEEVEAVELLAQLAGQSLGTAEAFQAEQRERRRQTEAASRDELTGLGSRREADAMLAEVQPGDGVLLLDLDHFKQVNDRLGHAGGDAVLRAFGAHLRKSLRTGDRAARFGGEEVLVVLRGGGAQSVAIADRLVTGWRADGPETTVSGGVAVHLPGQDAAETLARADAALYRAKAAGRDQVMVADGTAAMPQRP